MGRLSVNWIVSKQREIEEYAKTVSDLITHGEVRSKKHAAVLQNLFHQEQITIFRKQLPFYTLLLARWQKELDADVNHHVFFPQHNGQKYSVNGEQKIHLLIDLISMVADDDAVLNEGFFQSIRRKEVQLLGLARAEDGLTIADAPLLFLPLGKTYEELWQDYIDEVGLVYFQGEYSRVYKLLYYKLIRDLRGALRTIIRCLFRNAVDEDTDTNVYKNLEIKLFFKNIFIASLWTRKKLLKIYEIIWNLMNCRLQPVMQWKTPAG